MAAIDNILWQPQPKQEIFMSRGEDEALYGGAAGGGKSDALTVEALRQVHIPHYKGLLIRKTHPQMLEIEEKCYKLYPRAVKGAVYNATEHIWRFPKGSIIRLGSMAHEKDKFQYQGHAYDFIGFDELTHFSYSEYEYLISRNRSNGPGTRTYMRATANPGGVGHGWVKDYFVSGSAPMTTQWHKVKINMPDGTTVEQWKSKVFVPATVFDNPALLRNDPSYLVKLASMSQAEKEALLYGNWDSYSGQYFSEWKNDPEHYIDRKFTHVIAPFEPPAHWKIYRSYDFGSAKPFSLGWWAVDKDGVLYRIGEYYGWSGKPNEGLKMPPAQQFREIARIEREHPYLKGKEIFGIADPSIWNADRGESIAEVASKEGIYFSPGDNARIAGWNQVRNRLQFDDNGYPRIYFFNTCRQSIRTIPSLVHSERMVEDVDSDGEDHIADEVRYMCMARPVPALLKKERDIYIGDDPLDMFKKRRF